MFQSSGSQKILLTDQESKCETAGICSRVPVSAIQLQVSGSVLPDEESGQDALTTGFAAGSLVPFSFTQLRLAARHIEIHSS